MNVKSLGRVCISLAGIVPLSACFNPQTTVNSLRSGSVANNTPAEVGAAVPGGGVISPPLPSGPQTFSISAEESAKMLELGDLQTVNFVVRAGSSFNGSISLTADRGDWEFADPQGTVKFSIAPAQFKLGPGGSQVVVAKLSTETTAPASKAIVRVRAVATTSTGTLPTLVSQVTLSVQAILTVKMLGLKGVPRNPNNTPHIDESYELLNGAPLTGPFQVRPHSPTAPLRVRFINYDPIETHIIHGPDTAATSLTVSTGGTIPHGPTGKGLELAKAPAAGQPGGVYEVTIRPETAQTQSFYCHSHNADSVNHTLVLNFDLANVKFAAINKALIAPRCAGCHTDGKGDAPPLGSYATVYESSGKGNPFQSSLYSSITYERMPIKSAPFTADQKRQVWDWIILGAQNN